MREFFFLCYGVSYDYDYFYRTTFSKRILFILTVLWSLEEKDFLDEFETFGQFFKKLTNQRLD